MSRHKLHEAIRFVRPVAGAVDRVIRPRLSWLTEGPFTYAIAAICILIALPIPPLELMPFAAAPPALAVTLFGLGLIALAFGFSAACFFLAARSLW